MGMQVAEDEAMTAANAAFAARDEPTTTEATDPTSSPTPVADSAADQAAAPIARVEGERQVDPDPWPPAEPDPWRSATTPAAPATSAPATPAAPPVAPRPATSRPPSRFLADLVRAMRSTAEENRTSLVDGLRTEGKTSVEQIHARSAEEVDGLRRVAEQDVAGIKDWSKTEIARLRTETEERITERRQELELSLEGHAALIEREIEHVQARIAEYEAEMDAFFVRLEEVEDPSEFASVAAEMPEPPSLEEASAAARAAALDDLIRETTAARVPPAAPEAVAEPLGESIADAPVVETEAVDETEAVEPPVVALEATVAVAEDEVVTEPAEVVGEHLETVPEPIAAIVEPSEADASERSTPTTESRSDGTDPRLTALGLTADAPEAEAPASEPGIDAMSEATIAARLGDASVNGQSAPESTTSVVVVGLVSVASVAAFKRTLGKVAGVRSVGVSSGPEGEFVFKTTHDADVTLKDVVPTLPGFGARVVAAGDGVVNVSARDPESEA